MGNPDKVKTMVHDGTYNMREVASINTWVDVECSAHKLHLAVTSVMGIDKVKNSTISKCVGAPSRLIRHFSHSPLATIELEKRQLQMNAPEDKGQYVKTRWNSVYNMFQRLVKLRSYHIIKNISSAPITKRP